jgi:hypothetical protein
MDDGLDLQRGEATCQMCLPQSFTLVKTIPISLNMGHVSTRPTRKGSTPIPKEDVCNVMSGLNKKIVKPHFFLPSPCTTNNHN